VSLNFERDYAEEPRGRRRYVAPGRGKQLECKGPDVRRHMTGLAT